MVFKRVCHAIFDAKMIKKETPEGADAKTVIDYHNEATIALRRYEEGQISYKKFINEIKKIQGEANKDSNLTPFEKTQLFTELLNLTVDI